MFRGRYLTSEFEVRTHPEFRDRIKESVRNGITKVSRSTAVRQMSSLLVEVRKIGLNDKLQVLLNHSFLAERVV